MARTLNPAIHTVRRDAFVDAAQRLITQKGYEQMSVQDLLDELEASRGAFYHYFDSKEELLEAVVNRMVDAGVAAVAPVVDDPLLPAVRKFEAIFAGIQSFKAERKQLVLAILEVWISDHNALVREKFRRTAVVRLAPLLSAVIEQGNREEAFHTGPADSTARVLVGLMQSFGDAATELFVARQAGTIGLEEVQRAVEANTDACERILGLSAGSLTLIDEPALRFWFG
ncbi:MAG TPA: TetR/AcrR family transcriptional regulator [Candidatus Dormibacteraeota bacterium]|nr:TetR/AcrR family transcriptional regulator [Candidatus Dormibacteraeota bacterium]